MNEVLRCIVERRAIRKYKPEQVSEEELNAILLAGTYAPSAGGRQSVLFLVSQNPEINEKLGSINREFFYTSERRTVGRMFRPELPISRDQPSIADDVAISSAFYQAPTVITLFGPKDYPYSVIDCSVAAEKIMLVAHSLGVASCMISRAGETFAGDYGTKLLREWQVDENYEAICHVILGHRDGELPKGKPRKENRIKRIR